MEGLDDIGLTLQNIEAIKDYEARRPRGCLGLRKSSLDTR